MWSAIDLLKAQAFRRRLLCPFHRARGKRLELMMSFFALAHPHAIPCLLVLLQVHAIVFICCLSGMLFLTGSQPNEVKCCGLFHAVLFCLCYNHCDFQLLSGMCPLGRSITRVENLDALPECAKKGLVSDHAFFATDVSEVSLDVVVS